MNGLNGKFKKQKRILLSFVGTNDAGKLYGKGQGAILTALKTRRFDEVHLFWNPSKNQEVNFKKIAEYVRDEVTRNYCETVKLHQFDCEDVTDHNEIYPKLLAICQSLESTRRQRFTAAIASGTPAMQACWILMAESGDFNLELIRSNEPRFGKPPVTPVKLGTGLPRIFRLEQENTALKKEQVALIPLLQFNIQKADIRIGNSPVLLSPIEYCYYRYFAERAKGKLDNTRFGGIFVPSEFGKKIILYYQESFPDGDIRSRELEKAFERRGIIINTFRTNIARLNSKIRKALNNLALSNFFEVKRTGTHTASCYGIGLPAERIIIHK